MQRLETTQGPTHPAVNQIGVLWRPFFVISSLFSLLASLAAARPGKVQTLMQYSCSSVVHYFFKGFHASLLLFPRVSQSPTLISTISLFCDRTISLLSSLFSFPSSLAVALFSDPSSRLSLRSVHEAIDCAPNCFVLWRHLVLPLLFALFPRVSQSPSFFSTSRPSVNEPSLFSLLSSLFPLLSLLLFSQIPLRDCHFDLCIRPSMARHTASSHGDTPILIQTWFSHLNAYASTCAQ